MFGIKFTGTQWSSLCCGRHHKDQIRAQVRSEQAPESKCFHLPKTQTSKRPRLSSLSDWLQHLAEIKGHADIDEWL